MRRHGLVHRVEGLVEPVEDAPGEERRRLGFVMRSLALRVGEEHVFLRGHDRVVERLGVTAADVVLGLDDQGRPSDAVGQTLDGVWSVAT